MNLSAMTFPAVGIRVAIQGLQQRVLNDQQGICIGQTEDQILKGRVGVRLNDGKEISLRLDKIKAVFAVKECGNGKGMGVFAELFIAVGSGLVLEPPVLLR